MSHTREPWRVNGLGIEARAFDGSWKWITDRVRGGSPEEMKANIHLMAAAPALLTAVKEYLEWGAMTVSDRDLFEDKFRAAIARAEGQP